MTTNNAVNVGLSGSTGTGSFAGSNSPVFTGTPTIPSPFTLGGTSLTASAANLNLLAGAAQTVVQHVYVETGASATGTTQVPLDDTIPQNTEGDQYMSLAITPKSTTNILVIEVVFNWGNSTGSSIQITSLFQDSTANSLATGWSESFASSGVGQTTFRHMMAAGTTSSTTFKVRSGANIASTTTFNGGAGNRLFGGVFSSSLRITEFTP